MHFLQPARKGLPTPTPAHTGVHFWAVRLFSASLGQIISLLKVTS